MFAASKIAWFIANPQTMAFLLLALGTALLFTKAWRRGRAIIATVLAVAVITVVLPVGRWSVQALEHRFPQPTLPGQVDGIILLGGEIDQELSLAHGQPALGSGAGRLLAFAELARRYPDAKLVFTGGSGRILNQEQTEVDAMPLAFRAIGLDPARVTFEGRSRNTHENALFTRDLVQPKTGQNWVMITSAFHMPRAIGCFRRAGFPIIPYPADYQTPSTRDWSDKVIGFDSGYGSLSTAVREIIGLVAYRVAGYTDSIFPAP